MSKVTYAPWKHVPSTYILCDQDATMGVPPQQKLVAPERGGKWNVVHLDAGHSPFLSMPEKVEQIIREAAGEHSNV